MRSLKHIGVATFAVLALAACGGSSGSSATDAPTTPPDTAAATTAAPAATDAPSPPTDAPTTTAAGMSRDAQVAVARCVDQFGVLFAAMAALGGDVLTDAIAACDEAKVQLEVDGYDASDPLYLAHLDLAVDLAMANFVLLNNEWDDQREADLQAAVDEYVAAAEG